MFAIESQKRVYGLRDFGQAVKTVYDNIIDAVALEIGVDSNLIRAVIKTESDYNAKATKFEPALNESSSGLMQILPSTASSLMGKTLTSQDLFDPMTNITAGTKYLKQQLDRYHGDKQLAVSAYNAGHALVDSHGAIVNSSYVNKVMSNYQYFQTGKKPFNVAFLAVSMVGILVIGGVFMMMPTKQTTTI